MRYVHTLFLLIAAMAFAPALHAQAVTIHHQRRDTSYTEDYYHHLILRASLGTRFNNFKLMQGGDKLIYKPNQHFNLGLGFSYKIVSVTIDANLPLLLRNTSEYGTTHASDIQTTLFFQRFLIDLYDQVYRGYYLANTGDALTGNQPILKRPDIHTRDANLIFQYIFNDRRFSFNAPFNQNEVQKKSAGSLLAGGGIYHNDGNADSSFIPSTFKDPNFFEGYRFSSFSYTGVGINIGYAYTLVVKKHFFATALVSAGGGAGYVVTNSKLGHKLGQEYFGNGKFAAGYNSDKFFLGISYVRLLTQINSAAPHTWEQENAGYLRVTYAQRFGIRKSLIPKSNLIKIE